MFALVRHAGYELMSGSLTSDGMNATKALAHKLQHSRISWERIWTSPTKRTKETATLIAQELALSIEIDERIGMEGNFVDMLPPQEPKGKIIVSHLPVLTKMLRFWSRSLHQDEPPLTEVGHGYLIDPDNKTITAI